MEELASRAVASPHWRWMPGMLTLEEIVPPAITLGWDAARVLHADEGDAVRVCTVLGKARDIHDTALPDLTDPATLGCLLALVREVRHESTWLPTCLDAEDEAWIVEPPSRNRQTRHESYAAALVAALEAAP